MNTYILIYRSHSRIRKERSASGGFVELANNSQSQQNTPSSPSMTRKQNKQNQSQHSNYNAFQMHHSQTHHTRNQYHLIDLTIFHIPGLDVKVSCILFIFSMITQNKID